MTKLNLSRFAWVPEIALTAVSLFIVASISSQKWSPPVASAPSFVPPKMLRFFTLGYNEIVGDGLWLRTIQDFDYCENRPPGEGDPRSFSCKQGWVFHMIDSITEITPDFRTPYVAGGLMLSVIVNDISGASIIFDKAASKFSDDWRVLYYAAFHAMSEEKNLDKASELLVQVAKTGGPNWTLALAARLHEQSGRLVIAKTVLLDAINSTDNPAGKRRLEERLAIIDKQIAEEQAKQKH